MFSEQEQEQMLTALQGMIATTEKNSNELLIKLNGLFQIKSTNWIEVDFSDGRIVPHSKIHLISSKKPFSKRE